MACTTFLIKKDGNIVFGRNYDWVTETGVVHTNLRGQVKTSLPLDEGKSFEWTSQYGSITFNQYGKEFPTGGMNEAGLVVELMWLSESEFPKRDERYALSVLQWIQYVLDNCSTIDEVIATDKKVRIFSSDAPQHYLVADAEGNAATIEFLKGKMVVHRGDNLPYAVLANSPYGHSIDAVRRAEQKGDSAAFGDNSLQRFRTACRRVSEVQNRNFEGPLEKEAFTILDEIGQGDFTKWSIVYNITERSIQFRTNSKRTIKMISFKSFDLGCDAASLSLNMKTETAGDIRSHLDRKSVV